MRERLNGASALPLQRETHSGEVQWLPELMGLTEDDEAFARAMLALAETGAMFRGRYAEAHVARLLGAVFPATGINEWDLKIPGATPIRLEIKASAPSGRFDLRRLAVANDLVWVFVRIESPMGERPSKFSYAVAGPDRRDLMSTEFGRSVGVDRLMESLGTVDADELADVVRRAARRSR